MTSDRDWSEREREDYYEYQRQEDHAREGDAGPMTSDTPTPPTEMEALVRLTHRYNINPLDDDWRQLKKALLASSAREQQASACGIHPGVPDGMVCGLCQRDRADAAESHAAALSLALHDSETRLADARHQSSAREQELTRQVTHWQRRTADSAKDAAALREALTNIQAMAQLSATRHPSLSSILACANAALAALHAPAETRRKTPWLLCPHCLHRWNRNEFDVDAWAACPSCGGSFSYAKPRAIAAPTPTPAPEPPRVIELPADRLREVFERAERGPDAPEPPRAGECGHEWSGYRCDRPVGHESALHGVRGECEWADSTPPLPSSAAAAQEPKLPQFVSVVQREKGGVQIEGHTLKGDWELEIDANGDVVAFDGSDTIPRAELRRLRAEWAAFAEMSSIRIQAVTIRERIADLDRLLAVEGAQPLGNEPMTWERAARIHGESLASVGPNGYGTFTPQQWLDWTLSLAPAKTEAGRERQG